MPPPTDTDFVSTRPTAGTLRRTIGASGLASSRSVSVTSPLDVVDGPVRVARLVLSSIGRPGRSNKATPPSISTEVSSAIATRSANGKVTSAVPRAYGAKPSPPSAPPGAVGFSPKTEMPTSRSSRPRPLATLNISCSEGALPTRTDWPAS